MPDSPVITAANRFKAQVAREDAAALERLARAYASTFNRLQSEYMALVEKYEGETLTRAQILRLDRYKSLIQQTTDELQKYSAYTQQELRLAADLGIELGEEHGRQLISQIIAGDGSIAGEFARLPKDAIEQLLGFLAPDSPLYQQLEALAPFTVEQVSEQLITGIATGKNPRVIARGLNQAFGQGLTNAMRMVRTAQIYSYREANRAAFVASEVVEGWYWHAELSPGTCMSCINMHGTFHPLSETLNDHHNGRCAAIPAVKGFPPPLEEGAGEAWFSQQPESVQRQMMGKGLHEAWRGGKFDFNRLTTTYDDAVYSEMRRQATLGELTG